MTTKAQTPSEALFYSLDPFTRAYIEAALWSTNDESTPEGGEPMDQNYNPSNIHPETLAQMAKDCAEFQAANAEDIASGCSRGSGQYTTAEQAGHDFWLTRCGHGAGFWDGDWEGEQTPDGYNAGSRLTTAANAFGNIGLYIGDDGMIHQG